MAKALNKNRRGQAANTVSLSSKHCKDSLKNFCVPGSPFVDEIQIRAKTITPLLKGILEFEPMPRWSKCSK
jgi:hypothetical protein